MMSMVVNAQNKVLVPGVVLLIRVMMMLLYWWIK